MDNNSSINEKHPSKKSIAKSKMTDKKLIRGIGRWDLIAIVINTVIGAGIFGLPSKITKAAGSYGFLAFLGCTIIIVLVVLCFAEVSSRFKTTGGAYLYAREAYGPFLGFQVGWVFWITRFTAFAANGNVLIDYLGDFHPSLSTGALRVFIISLIVCGLTYINIIGLKESVRTTNILTIAKLIPLLLFAVVGIFFIQPANFDFSVSPDAGAYASAIIVAIYAFAGFESAVIPAGEMKDAKKNAPFALMTAIGIIVAFYIVVQIVAIGTLPELAESEKPLVDSARIFAGEAGAKFILIGAVISILGNLNVGLLATTRLLFSIAKEGDIPKIFSKLHPKFNTPYVSIILTSIGAFIFTVQSTFLKALTISVVSRIIVYGMTCLALIVFRFRKDAPKAEFLAPFGILASILSLITLAWLLYNAELSAIIQVAVAIVIGIVIYFVYRFSSGNNGYTKD